VGNADYQRILKQVKDTPQCGRDHHREKSKIWREKRRKKGFCAIWVYDSDDFEACSGWKTTLSDSRLPAKLCRGAGPASVLFSSISPGAIPVRHTGAVCGSRLLPLLFLLAAASGCTSPPLAAPTAASPGIRLNESHREVWWERSVRVLNSNHFQVARESKLEGVIETAWRGGSGLLEPWHGDSVGVSNRLESTLQSIRRRVTVVLQSSADNTQVLTVRVDKEIEDLPGLAANYEGGATFSESQPLNRDLSQVVGQTGPSRWVSVGRDPLLEQKILAEIRDPRR
jgi:hypothetical protein